MMIVKIGIHMDCLGEKSITWYNEAMITIYTDGSSKGNPGPGGYGVVLFHGDKPQTKTITNARSTVVELGGKESYTTNNRMELTAIRESLTYIESHNIDGNIELYTDSTYAMQGLQTWMYGWAKNDWKTSTGEEVQNQDIWKTLLGLMFRLKKNHDIDILKVKGHSGDVYNERCDVIATTFADNERILLFKGELDTYTKLFSLEENTKTIVGASMEIKQSRSKKAFSYVSKVDGKIYIDPTWNDCEKRVKGKKGARYKKTFSKDEELAVVKEYTTP